MAYVPPHRREVASGRAFPAKSPPPTPVGAAELTFSQSAVIPAVNLPAQVSKFHGDALVEALSPTGLILVEASDVLSVSTTDAALRRTRRLLTEGRKILGVRKGAFFGKKNWKESVMLKPHHVTMDCELDSLWRQMQEVKRRALSALELGLGLPVGDLLFRHSEESDCLRLVRYPAVSANIPPSSEAQPSRPGARSQQMQKSCLGERCYEHVDYGTITLLLADSPGLEVKDELSGNWVPVPCRDASPHASVAMLVGMELSEITGARLKAAMHRVPGPCSQGSLLLTDELRATTQTERHAVILFTQREQYSDSAGAGRQHPTNNTPERYVQGASPNRGT